MIPSRSVVKSIVQSWRLGLELSDHDWQSLTSALINLSEANGGRVFFDVPLDQKDFDGHFRESSEAVIQRSMRLRAQQLGAAPSVPYRMVDTDGTAPLPSLQRRRSAPRIDINKATRQMLIESGGVSADEAESILAARRAAGRFTDLAVIEQLLTKDAWSQFNKQFCIHSDNMCWRELSKGQKEFINEPTLRNYIRITETLAGGGVEALLNLLDEIRQEVVPTKGFNPRRITAASEIALRTKVRRKVAELENNSVNDLSGVALLDKSQYLEFLLTTFAEASETIRVVMFFMTHQVAAPRADGKPAKPLALERVLSALVAAKERGVDVRVILDKDGPTDVFNSRRINQHAYRFFVDHDIPVVFSSANKVIHSKIVVVDRRHVLIGSHNWTLGSMYNYDEKSVYVESNQLGKLLEERFDELWRNPQAEGAVRDQLLTTIEDGTDSLRSRGIYSADDFLQKTMSAEWLIRFTESSEMTLEKVGALRREITLRELESRMAKLARRIPRRTEALKRSVGPARGRARVLTVIPGEKPGSRTVFTLSNHLGDRYNLPFRLAPGTAALLKAKVVNQGESAEAYRLQIAIGNEPEMEHTFSLAAGEEKELPVAFNAPQNGYKKVLSVTLDQNNRKTSEANSLYLVVTGDTKARNKGNPVKDA